MAWENTGNKRIKLAVNAPELDLIDPTPDIHALFQEYNKEFFWGRLGAVTVEWSKRMTSCAGLCYYQGRSGGCRIKLSQPLLSLRPRSDLVDTLIHEMIHAYIFLVNEGHRLDRSGHGPDFQEHMWRINKVAGTNITVYHTFHDEVDFHQKHWWQCSGPCRSRAPYFGLVKRAMNRAPGPNDFWWAEHQLTCGGAYTKIKEPEKVVKKKEPKGQKLGGATKTKDISSYFKTTDSTRDTNQSNKSNGKDFVALSDDDDEDFKRALEFSMMENQTTSSVSRYNPGGTRTNGDVHLIDTIDSDDDEDFKRALELSMMEDQSISSVSRENPGRTTGDVHMIDSDDDEDFKLAIAMSMKEEQKKSVQRNEKIETTAATSSTISNSSNGHISFPGQGHRLGGN